MPKKTIVISAVNIRKGGTLTILRECLAYLSTLPENDYSVIALVHKKELAEYEGIKYIELPYTINSWFYRLWCEYVTMYKLSKKLQPVDLWLSLHDTTPRVLAKRQAVYCQTSFPFLKWKLADLRYDPKVVLFSLFTRYAYRMNIHRNKYLIVQSQWLREGFSNMFGIPWQRFIVCPPQQRPMAYNKMRLEHKYYTFLFASTPDCHKNFETLCKAAEELENKIGEEKFSVVLTIDGNENKYSQNLFARFRKVSSIRFEGFMSKDKLYSFYDSSDCLIFPSRIETWGLPITEFATTGKPLLLADLPYAHETSAGCKKVAFFDPNDPDDLMSKMEMLCIGDESRLRPVPLKEIAQPVAYSWDELFDKLLEN